MASGELLLEFISLALIAVFGFIYGVLGAVVILPGLMFGSLITKFLGLELYPPIVAFSPMAAALIVFTAGLEVDMDFLNSHKFSLILTIFFEYVLLFPILYVLYIYISRSISYILLALSVASNEAFALAVGHEEETRKYGIVISVLEDSIAVFLLALGFYTFQVGYELEVELLRLIMLTMVVVLVLFVFSKPFASMIEMVRHPEAKSLVAILYILILILVSENLNLPEALVVFLGGIFLSYYVMDDELNVWMHSYMYLALMGYVISLPYFLEVSIGFSDFLTYIMLGAIAGVASYFLRVAILYISTNLAGIAINSSILLSLTLANSGEFGLIVLGGLVSQGVIEPWAFYVTLFGYAFNLTIVSYVARNITDISAIFLQVIPESIFNKLFEINNEVKTYFEYLWMEGETVKEIYQILLLTATAYLSTGLLYLISRPFESVVIFGFQLSIVIVTLYFTYRRFVERTFKTIKRGLVLPVIFEFAITILVLLSLVESIRITLTRAFIDTNLVIVSLIIAGILASIFIRSSYILARRKETLE